MAQDAPNTAPGADESGDPATQAFNALGGKVETLDRAVKRSAALTDGLIEHVRKIEQSMKDLALTPALKLTPAQFGKQFDAVMHGAIRSAETTFKQQAKAERARNDAVIQAEVRARLTKLV